MSVFVVCQPRPIIHKLFCAFCVFMLGTYPSWVYQDIVAKHILSSMIAYILFNKNTKYNLKCNDRYTSICFSTRKRLDRPLGRVCFKRQIKVLRTQINTEKHKITPFIKGQLIWSDHGMLILRD